jgi:hypothetical protein
MTIIFNQTATTMVCARSSYCAVGVPGTYDSTENIGLSALQAQIGGTTGGGGTTWEIIVSSNSTTINVWWELPIPSSGVSWDAGDWAIRTDVIGGSNGVKWQDSYVCRVNSACVSQESLGSTLGLAEKMAAGVHVVTVTASSATPSAGDKIIIVNTFSNETAKSTSFDLHPTVQIDSPFSTFSTGEAPAVFPQLTLVGVGQ